MSKRKSYQFDVFLSYSANDRQVVADLAERLRSDGLRIWFDVWRIKPDDDLAAATERGLERSRVLLLFLSTHSIGSDWAQLEGHSFRFRDPLNRERRFIPLRLDDTPLPGSLATDVFIDWRRPSSSEAYVALLQACRPPPGAQRTERNALRRSRPADEMPILTGAFSPDRTLALTGGGRGSLELWDIPNGTKRQTFVGGEDNIWAVAWSPDGRFAVSGGDDHTLSLWEVATGTCLRVFKGHSGGVSSLHWSADQRLIYSGGDDNTTRIWDWESGRCLKTLVSASKVFGLAVSKDGKFILAGGRDCTISLWDVKIGKCLRIFEGHTDELRVVTLSPDQKFALSGGSDGSVRLWDIRTGQCLRILSGHEDYIWSLDWSDDQRFILSGSSDNTVRVWDVATGHCRRVLEGHEDDVRLVAWNRDQRHALSGDCSGVFRTWDLSDIAESPVSFASFPVASPAATQYTNAKVLLVGDSSAGKTGLSRALAGLPWEPSDSTIGAWATQWKLPAATTRDGEREIWLWDFGGQADQRLIHQLYFEDTAAAVLVFDGQKDTVLETLGLWDREMHRAASRPFAKLLAAGRIDAGMLRVSRTEVERFGRDRGYAAYLETSAKEDIGCADLRQAIVDSIDWDQIPWRSSPLVFKYLKDEIIRIKGEKRTLLRFNELRDALWLRMASGAPRFEDSELQAVIRLLSGPGVVWELSFGSWILLQPEYINTYAQAVIQTLREDDHERGCILEARILSGDLAYRSSMQRLPAEEERFTLHAMVEALVKRGLCMREQTDTGALLIFPSYYRRERPDLIGHPAVLVSYQFTGFLDDIYATLVVRLHHSEAFARDQLWHYAADMKTLTGRQLGIKLIRRAEGAGELDVYFDPAIPQEEQIIFSKYVHEHLLGKAQDVVRLRHYVCPHCGTPVGNREVAMRRLMEGKTDIACVNCDSPDKRIPLWDELEELFASEELRDKVRSLQAKSEWNQDSESLERVLVGEVISAVALAGQLSREFTVSDHGIDMEIEFKSDRGEATGKKVYLQLKSGDSYLTTRKKDGARIFKIPKKRHAQYWQDQAFPVLLLIRDSNGDIHWMEVRDYLRRLSREERPLTQIEFTGKRFDVMSVRNWRDDALRK